VTSPGTIRPMRVPVFIVVTALFGCDVPLAVSADLTDPAVPVFTATSSGAVVAAVNVLRVKRCPDDGCGALDDTFFQTPAGDEDWMWGVADENVAREGARTPALALPVAYGVRPALVGVCSCSFDENAPEAVPLGAGTFAVGVSLVNGAQRGLAFAPFTIDAEP
jgi:hypothetical protein